MTLLSFVILTICFAMQCTTMAMGTDIDTKTIQHGGGMHNYTERTVTYIICELEISNFSHK